MEHVRTQKMTEHVSCFNKGCPEWMGNDGKVLEHRFFATLVTDFCCIDPKRPQLAS